jgi:hypothetical protein
MFMRARADAGADRPAAQQALDINQAIKEGRVPVAGPPGGGGMGDEVRHCGAGAGGGAGVCGGGL